MGRSYGVLLCAVLSGVDAESLALEGTGAAYSDLTLALEGTGGAYGDLVTMAAGGMNGTGTGKIEAGKIEAGKIEAGKIETGAIVSIALGGVAALLLAIGLVLWYLMGKRSGARNADVAPANRGNALFDFAIPASDCPPDDQMPLLRFTIASNRAK
jgi:hypothetical protein